MNAQRIYLDANEGFTRKPATADLARHQLHVSFGVMGVILAAGLALFSTFDMKPARPGPQILAGAMVQQPDFVRPVTAQVDHNSGEHTGG